MSKSTVKAADAACSIFVPLSKIDESKREVWGVLAEEALDRTSPTPEIMDYASSKPYFEEWSKMIADASAGKSLGNLRAMHDSKRAAGKLIALEFDDAAKKVRIGTRVVDDADWQKVVEGVYLGFSIGGSYVKRWPDKVGETQANRYTAKPFEASLCDLPCMPGAVIEFVRADGVSVERVLGDDGRTVLAKSEPSEDDKPTPPAVEEPPSGEEAAPVEKSSDPAAVELTAEQAIETLKALLAETAQLAGDPNTWTLAGIVEALSAAVSAKYAAQVAAQSAETTTGSAQGTMAASVSIEDFDALRKTVAALSVSEIEKSVVEGLDKVRETIETLSKSRETDAAAVNTLRDTVSAMEKTIETLSQTVEKIGRVPVQPGRPVEKRLGDGTAPAGETVSLARIGEAVNRMVAEGKVTPAQERDLRVELATLALR